MVEAATDKNLDDYHKRGIEAHQELFEYREEREAGCVLWSTPPVEGHQYVVVGDPGHGRPPYRNAPVVIVVDITEVPDGPARLVGFWWGDGGGKIEPFVQQVLGWREIYHALNCAYDATAGQKVYSEFPFKGMDDIIPIDLSGSGVKKKSHLNTLKIKMLQGHILWPFGIKGLRWQFLKYKLPDEKIAQDIVSAFVIYAGFLWWLGLQGDQGEKDVREAPIVQVKDRYGRTASPLGSGAAGGPQALVGICTMLRLRHVK